MRRAAALLAVALVAGSCSPRRCRAARPISSSARASARARSTCEWNDFPIRYFVTDRGAAASPRSSSSRDRRRVQRLGRGRDRRALVRVRRLHPGDPLVGRRHDGPRLQNRPDLDRVLGATSFIVDTTTGEIVESDIYFNSASRGRRAGGQTGRYDLESIARARDRPLHGLGHSALGETEVIAGGRRVLGAEAVMFPIAFAAGNIRTARSRPTTSPASPTSIRPARSRRTPAASAAGSPRTAAACSARTSSRSTPRPGKLVGGFTLNEDGAFVIAGLEPGRTCCASSRWTTATSRASSSRRWTSTWIPREVPRQARRRSARRRRRGHRDQGERRSDARCDRVLAAGRAPSCRRRLRPRSRSAARRRVARVDRGRRRQHVVWPGFDVGSSTAELTRSGQASEAVRSVLRPEGDVDGFPRLARAPRLLPVSVDLGRGWFQVRQARTLGPVSRAMRSPHPDETAVETLSHYVFGGSVIFDLRGASFAGRPWRAVRFGRRRVTCESFTKAICSSRRVSNTMRRPG